MWRFALFARGGRAQGRVARAEAYDISRETSVCLTKPMRLSLVGTNLSLLARFSELAALIPISTKSVIITRRKAFMTSTPPGNAIDPVKGKPSRQR